MIHPRRGIALLGMLLAASVRLAALAEEPTPDPAGMEFFEKKIRPILTQNCYECHSNKLDEPKSRLRLDSRDGMLQGGEHGRVIVPGKPEKSRLVTAVSYTDTRLRMPPKGKLSDEKIADLTEWVRMGAPWPREKITETTTKKGLDIEERKRSHWAWRPVRATPPPDVKDKTWPMAPVDEFILAKLEENDLRPAEPADRRTWLRRVYFDIIGLPPTADEIESFLQDQSSDARARVVDHLLASPRFGERWGRHWLDLVRYAESRGHEFDPIIPNAYQYRDYVIRALNADVPYNQFVMEHLAGDLLKEPRVDPVRGCNESLLGTGFWFLGEEVHSPVDIRQDQADRFDNRIDVFSKTFLGLTVACARCHDHKFDAISQKDYYALFGFLSSSSYRLARFDTVEHNRKVAVDLAAVRDRQRKEIGKALAAASRPNVDKLADYLQSARQSFKLAQKDGLLPGKGSTLEFNDALRKRLDEVAAERKLDAALLREWMSVLSTAAKDARDPLRAFAIIAMDPDTDDEKRVRELVQPLVAAMQKETEALESSKDMRILVDYRTDSARDWHPDDAAFGTRPVHPGDVRLGGDSAHPSIRCITRGAAEYDRQFDVLKIAAGSEMDPGALGKGPPRSGRTLCTASFRIKQGKLHYFIRGAGSVYAAVSAHVEIDGPLHGQLVMTIPNNPEFHWYTQDLTRYVGLDAHLEFTAAPGSNFAVVMAVESPQPPTTTLAANESVLKLLKDDSGSAEKLAAGYARLFTEALDAMEADRIGRSVDPEGLAALANWWLLHPQLFSGPSKEMQDIVGRLFDEEKKLAAQIQAESRLAVAMLDCGSIDEHLFIRGVSADEGEAVPRRFLQALAGTDPIRVDSGSGRLELAREVTDPASNPFIARVIVNRVWHHLFGRGIVPSVDNFGVLGEAPTHPELLDYLADRFVREGWSIKTLIRELVLTSSYGMSAQAAADADKADPNNGLLHRMRLRRLEGESIRDAMLSISGRLDGRTYGPSIPIYLTPFLDGRGRPGSGPLDGAGRRSLYLAVKRNFLAPMLLAFDTPSPFSTVGRRNVSNVPAQALILLNDPFVQQQAAQWAKRIMGLDVNPRTRINHMYVDAFARPPTEAELQACLDFLKSQASVHKVEEDDEKVWTDLAHTLFNVKEFIFLN